MSVALTILLIAIAIPVLIAALYLGVLAVCARRAHLPRRSQQLFNFDIIVPAHNEAHGIGRTIASLLAVDYPPERRRVLVVADNCTDATAAAARIAGATVIVRDDPARKGKGYALKFAFEHAITDRFCNAVVVVDADSLVSANLLTSFASHFGAGELALQARYGVSNRDASWRTRLLSIGFALLHVVRASARERLGLSVGLRGNGMAFSTILIREHPHEAFSIVEDMEYAVQLGLAGVRVHDVDDAAVYGDMPGDERTARSQRRRWEGGRLSLVAQYLPQLLRSAIASRSLVPLDLAAEILVPPLSSLALLCLVGGGLSVLVSPLAFALFAAALACICIYVGRGVVMAGDGFRGFLTLLWAPLYLLWKVSLLVRTNPHKKSEWVRTAREGDR